MEASLGWILGCSLLFLLTAIGITGVTAWRNRQIMNRLNAMLEAAAGGSFSEKSFDESLLSAVEVRMANYLSAAELSARRLSEEKEQIKALISDISHQTKTPISNILLYSQLMMEQELPPETRPALQALNGQAEKLAFLVDALVKMSRLESGLLTLRPAKRPLSSLLARVIEQAAPRAQAKSIQLAQASLEEEAAIFACYDLKWTAEALYNLVDNAIKYTREGGHVHLGVKAYELFVRIDVSDDGPGIDEEEHARIFTRFYRSPEATDTEGVGIGLYLARQIVSEQGGYMKVSSQPGSGSTFSVFLPIASEETGRISSDSERILQNC